MSRKNMDMATWHMIQVAKSTLKKNDVFLSMLGGPTKADARQTLKEKAGWSDTKIRQWEDSE